MTSYATASASRWVNADYPLEKCGAVCEILNVPDQFVHKSTYLVVDQVDWIATRYLLVKTWDTFEDTSGFTYSAAGTTSTVAWNPSAPTEIGAAYEAAQAFRPMFEAEVPMIEMDPSVRESGSLFRLSY
jgi:hypothetical protein